jgi:hypothetical protein
MSKRTAGVLHTKDSVLATVQRTPNTTTATTTKKRGLVSEAFLNK